MPVQALLGKKIGMTTVFREATGEALAVTAVQVGPCTITQIKTVETDGYRGVQIGFDQAKRVTKPMKGHLKTSGGGQFRYIREVPASDLSDLEVGQQLNVSLFTPGEKIEVSGLSRGRGFQGGVRRHHFKGGPKTHGQSDRHRAPGSIGAGTTPGRVIKGLRMAGHMGNAEVKVRNLEVVSTDPERNLIMIKGAVPGHTNTLLVLAKTGRKG